MAHLRKPKLFYPLAFLAASGIVTSWLVLGPAWSWAFSWFVAANLVALPLWTWDKLQARRDGPRVPESSLHTMAVLGAAPASLVGILLLRHKSRKPSFRVLHPVILGAQLVVVGWLAWPAIVAWFRR